MALSPNASFKILYVSEAVLPSLKQNFMQIRCSFALDILAGRYDSRTALTRCHKNAQKTHTLPHSGMPLCRMIHKRYSSRYLVGHNCTKSCFPAAFQFREFLGSTSYHNTVRFLFSELLHLVLYN